MNEKPILFSGPMVRAILENRKTMTRRVMKPQPTKSGPYSEDYSKWRYIWLWGIESWGDTEKPHGIVASSCPYGFRGTRLWVRETWADNIPGCPGGLTYRADHLDPSGDGPANPIHWRPSIHMPRWVSRLTLEITGVKVERVQDISGADAVAEGVTVYSQADLKGYDDAVGGARIASVGIESAAIKLFTELWNSINGKRPGCSWQDNPWVWCISFKRVTL